MILIIIYFLFALVFRLLRHFTFKGTLPEKKALSFSENISAKRQHIVLENKGYCLS